MSTRISSTHPQAPTSSQWRRIIGPWRRWRSLEHNTNIQNYSHDLGADVARGRSEEGKKKTEHSYVIDSLLHQIMEQAPVPESQSSSENMPQTTSEVNCVHFIIKRISRLSKSQCRAPRASLLTLKLWALCLNWTVLFWITYSAKLTTGCSQSQRKGEKAVLIKGVLCATTHNVLTRSIHRSLNKV